MRKTIIILLAAAVIVLAPLAAVTYQAKADIHAKYEKVSDELEQEQRKNTMLQKENNSMTDHIWHLNQNLMHQEDAEEE